MTDFTFTTGTTTFDSSGSITVTGDNFRVTFDSCEEVTFLQGDLDAAKKELRRVKQKKIQCETNIRLAKIKSFKASLSKPIAEPFFK